eukprot:1354614-Rhodomonas_salina.1
MNGVLCSRCSGVGLTLASTRTNFDNLSAGGGDVGVLLEAAAKNTFGMPDGGYREITDPLKLLLQHRELSGNQVVGVVNAISAEIAQSGEPALGVWKR